MCVHPVLNVYDNFLAESKMNLHTVFKISQQVLNVHKKGINNTYISTYRSLLD